MKKRAYVLGFFIIAGIIFLSVYRYIYKDHRNISKEEAAFNIAAKAINLEFIDNASLAEKKYINKVLIVSGVVTEINSTFLTLENSIFCQFKNSIPDNTKVNSYVYLKGRYIGYDDLLNEIKLDQCSIINQKF